MEPDDPFGWIMEACQVSSSEESSSRGCSYFGLSDSDDSDSGGRTPPDIPVASTGITMVSPPESPEDVLPNDQHTLPEDKEIFHTPPESRSTSTSFDNCNDDRMIGNGLDRDRETVPTDADNADSGRAVDLERDTDLGFQEVEVDPTQRIEANSNQDDTFRRESEEIRVSKREFSPKGKLSTESLSKRLKSLDESPSVRLRTPKEGNTEELLKSLKNVSPSPGATSELDLENQQNRGFNFEVGEGSVRKRRLDFSTEAIDSETDERNIESENNNGEDSSSRVKSLDVLTKDMECDTEEVNIESETDNGEGNSGRNKNIIGAIDQVRYTAENGSNSHAMEEKTERKRALPSWANRRVEDDESADEELEVSETELPSWANGTVGDDERADEELEVNERKLPSRANGRVGDDERADQELDVNERETVHSSMDSDGLSENFEEITILDVLKGLEKDCEEDRSLESLSLLEVAEKKWGTFSSAE